MVVRISDKTQNYSKVTKLLVKPNTIIPCFGNVVTVAILYWALGLKKVKSSSLIWIVIIVAIVLGAIGFLG